jgi:hypothetical protein
MNRTLHIFRFLNYNLLWLIYVVLSIQCAGTTDRQDRDADFAGFIADVRLGDLGQDVVVTVDSHADKLLHRGTFVVPATCVIVREGSDQSQLSVADLQRYQRVQVWLTKRSKTPYPEEGTAKKIVLVSKPKNDNEP